MSAPQAQTLNSRFFAPSWWVRAYESAVIAQARTDIDPFHASLQSGMSPSLSSFELSSLCVVLSTIQQQIIQGSTTVRIDPEHHRQFVSTNAKSKVREFEQALLLLSALKFLKSHGDGTIEAVPIFRKELWRRDKQHRSIQVDLEPSDLGAQMLLGYCEPYTDMLRTSAQQITVAELLGTRPPLALWRSTWLDFHGMEQILLLRMEQAMQWDFRWLTLDGVFGKSLPELFQDLELPKLRTIAAAASPMQKWLKVLNTFGKKMVDHGMITLDWEDSYLAMAPADTGLDKMLVWHAAAERIAIDDSREYMGSVCRHFWQQDYRREFARIIRTIAGPTWTPSLQSKFDKVQDELWQMEKDQSSPVVLLDGNMPIAAPCLFIEWMIRLKSDLECGIPNVLRSSSLVQCAEAAGQPGRFAESYHRFTALLAEDREAPQFLENLAGATLVSRATQKDPQYHSYLVEQSTREVATIPGSVSSAAGKEAKSPTIPQPSPTAAAPNKAGSEFSRTAQLKKIAGEELLNLRKRDPQGYQKLKESYLSILAEHDRKMIQTLQLRLAPEHFDEQIKHRLIKYMLDNPSAWQSAQAPLY